MRDLVDETVKRFGRLDVAVNNSGTEGKPGPATDKTPETCAATFDRGGSAIVALEHANR